MSFEEVHHKELMRYNDHLIFLKKLNDLCVNKCCILKYDYQDKIKYRQNKSLPYEPLEFNIESNDVGSNDVGSGDKGLCEYLFTIEDIEERISGCNQCKTKYPAVTLYGHCVYKTGELYKCEISCKTFNSFSCKCYFLEKTCSGLFFQMFCDNDYSHWENIYLKYNIRYHLLFGDCFINISSG